MVTWGDTLTGQWLVFHSFSSCCNIHHEKCLGNIMEKSIKHASSYESTSTQIQFVMSNWVWMSENRQFLLIIIVDFTLQPLNFLPTILCISSNGNRQTSLISLFGKWPIAQNYLHPTLLLYPHFTLLFTICRTVNKQMYLKLISDTIANIIIHVKLNKTCDDQFCVIAWESSILLDQNCWFYSPTS